MFSRKLTLALGFGGGWDGWQEGWALPTSTSGEERLVWRTSSSKGRAVGMRLELKCEQTNTNGEGTKDLGMSDEAYLGWTRKAGGGNW